MVGELSLQVDVVKAIRAPVSPAFIRSVVTAAVTVPEVMARMPAASKVVAVRITGDRELRVLNRLYAGIDAITDVLSFEGLDGHLGDIAVSWPACVRQSIQYEHSVETELSLLCVHGLLHLLGWDHGSAAQRKEMSRLTRAALAVSGIRIAPARL